MTIGPDDLPDPFGEGGLSQVICGCTSEDFHLILTEDTFQARCTRCGQVQAEWPQPVHPATRSRRPDRSARQPQVHAAWGPAEPAGEDPPAGGPLPPLPAFRPDQRDVHLSGGPYDGQDTWVPGDKLIISGVAAYSDTGRRTSAGLRVFAWQPPIDPGPADERGAG